MAVFQELVKNNENIKDYAREFFIYGYKSRNDMTINSKRSYDNEKRRIESFLPDHVKCEMGVKGKKVSIDINPDNIQSNPLYPLWETKSFTKYDCMFHFILPEILATGKKQSINQIYDRLMAEYISKIEIEKLPDIMTLRNKLKEYVNNGLFESHKLGRSLVYDLKSLPLKDIDEVSFYSLVEAIQFFKNVIPMGLLGHQLEKNLLRERGLDKEVHRKSTVNYLHYFIFHTLDDDILIHVMDHIRDKNIVNFDYIPKSIKDLVIKKGVPLKVYTNVKHGRRYVVIYDLEKKSFFSLRIDKIKKMKVLGSVDNMAEIQAEFDTLSKDAWGVYINKKKKTEKIRMRLHIVEKYEQFIIKRIQREGKHGTLRRTDKNLFTYEVEVLDTNEMVPWLRTFIGRIVDIEGCNTKVISRFKEDLAAMYDIYDLGEVTDEKDNI